MSTTATSGPLSENGPAGLQGIRIQRSTLAATLVTKLREQILSGRLAPGTPLPTEKDIGQAFGVGRTTVREALQGLIAAGLVQRQAKKLIVQDPRQVSEREMDYGSVAVRASIQEVFHTRRLLEVEGARLAATHRTPEDLAALRGVLEQMDPSDPEAYHALDLDFHTLVMAATGNSVLTQVYQSTRQLLFKGPAFWRVFGRMAAGGGGPAAVVGGRRSHEEIYQAIEAKDPERAAKLAEEHLRAVERALVERVRTSEARFGLSS